uniref:Uncharacterized protein n=1 Tax=Timema bartmani TaxID=61472 RepID=A0A7R9EXP9_9NEOP|nr:unnamed protein product [Timema bartmani]
MDVPGYDHHAFTNCSTSRAEAKAWQFQRTSNLLTSTLKKDPTVVDCSSSLDIFEEGNSAPAPVEDTADCDGWVVGVTASTPRESCLLIQVFGNARTQVRYRLLTALEETMQILETVSKTDEASNIHQLSGRT